ncbi:MAG: bifunctional diaminohydroxyphosphoribosylaminopyrimidine deaminase/5-amino-6-(5-phosphoribosylamino)uracil reductase RibD [Chloroflexota bacterium]
MDYMRLALSLSKLALGHVSPNPAVGAVLVKGGKIIGQGYTQPPGSAHAEIVALEQAGEKARGSTLYVTLEPCCHYGRTPPCTKAIIKAGVSKVHAATLDPNPLVSGKGRAELEQHGVEVQVGECEEEAKQINEAFFKFITTGMPFVTAKFATSLDGKIATRSGDSKWISGDESRRYVHYLRYVADAVMVGANTVITDDPRLTVRCCGEVGGRAKKQPLRIIVDGRGRTPPAAQLFNEPGKTLVVLGTSLKPTEKRGFVKSGAELLELSLKEGEVDLIKLFKTLGEREITSVLVEGGAMLLGSLFDCNLVDKVVAFIAPIIIGGKDAKTSVAGKGVDKVIDSNKLERVSTERFGDDVMVSGYVKKL